jgi:hypothetical protein
MLAGRREVEFSPATVSGRRKIRVYPNYLEGESEFSLATWN